MSEWVVSSSILILLIIGIRSCFRNKIALRARYALWLVVALRLVVPLSFSESSLSVLNFLGREADSEGQAGVVATARRGIAEIEGGTFLAPAEEEWENSRVTAPGGEVGQPGGEKVSGGSGLWEGERMGMAAQGGGFLGTAGENPGTMAGADEGDISAAQMEGAAGSSVTPEPARQGARHTGAMGFGRKTLLFCIWVAGAGAIACIVSSINSNYRRRIYGSRIRYRTKVKSKLPVYITPAVLTPCMFGLFHPAVYLAPGMEGDDKALRYVLCHENTHYRHRDNLWALIRVVCVCLHWYNPLVWIAAGLSRQDCELACDEKALELLGEGERIGYGRTLLDFSVQSDALPGGLQLSTAVSGGKKQLKERLMMIVGRPSRPAGALALMMALVLLVSAATFTGKVQGKGLGEDPWEGDMGHAVLDEGAVPVDGNVAGRSGNNDGTQNSVSNSSIVPVNLKDGKDYILKICWEDGVNGEEYRIERVELNRIQGKQEEALQSISLADVKVLYTRALEDIRKNGGQMWAYSPQGEVLYAKPLCTAEDLPPYATEAFQAEGNGASLAEVCDGGIMVEDLNFDGYQDFYLRGRGEGENVPYYCYLWNEEEGRFQPGYMVPNLHVDKDAKLVESATTDKEGVYSVKYYRFDENYVLHMLRYVEENKSPDAVLPKLDLSYCETTYALPAVDEWDYGTRYGGALAERFVRLAKDALAELYEWSGTRLGTVCFTVTEGGEVIFGNTPGDMDASRNFYRRCYGESAGFDSWIRQMSLSTERVVWYSPVTQWKVPENLDRMTDEEVVLWYFARSALAEGEAVGTIEETYEDTFVIRTEAGNYYEVGMQPSTREISDIYGPYDGFPVH